MRRLIALLAVAALGGCGLDVATTAATSAAIKKQELEQGKKTMAETQKKIDQALELQQQRADRAADNAEK